VEHQDPKLAALIANGKDQGYLTYDDVISFLPDDALGPEKLDELTLDSWIEFYELMTPEKMTDVG